MKNTTHRAPKHRWKCSCRRDATAADYHTIGASALNHLEDRAAAGDDAHELEVWLGAGERSTFDTSELSRKRLERTLTR